MKSGENRYENKKETEKIKEEVCVRMEDDDG